MSADHVMSVDWVVLSMGDRPAELAAAVGSLRESLPEPSNVIVLSNGAGDLGPSIGDGVVVIEEPENLGIPGGRDRAVREVGAEIVGFLDDDAQLLTSDLRPALAEFAANPTLAVIALRLTDEDGETARRHVPRPGRTPPDRSGEVTLFLGGACLMRTAAYHEVGGYFADLVYGHEELELSWRLADHGWRCIYRADLEVFHPRTDISRHPQGWFLTGRNRLLIARRSLPWPVAFIHVLFWLGAGLWRAPDGECRRAYLHGWWRGWTIPLDRRPIRWRTVWWLGRRGRVPLI